MINYWNVIQRTHREKDNQELLKYLAEKYFGSVQKMVRQSNRQNTERNKSNTSDMVINSTYWTNTAGLGRRSCGQ